VPLISTILHHELSKVMDSDYPSFSGFGNSQLEVSEKWANALDSYTSGIILPTTTQAVAHQAFVGVFSTIVQPNGIPIMQQAFTAYGATLSLGMITPAFTSTPPPAPINLTPVFSVPLNAGTNQTRVSILSTIIDLWFRTGLYTSIPGGVTSPWS
jgi:hypothetical protein